MKVTKHLKYIALFAILFSQQSFGAVDCNVNGGKACRGPIGDILTAVFPTDAGDVLLTSPLVINSLNCSGVNGFNNIRLLGTHGRLEETYALVLFALANNDTVTLRLTDESILNGTECQVAYIRLEI